ncbi:MAG: hypothetical protein DMF72_11500 [Acidobacteria bacterium]|nr:MAG: hypothetical protein DMF72_11500 [Acidobacteriota bacterium]
MNQIADSMEPQGLVRDTDSALESRIFRTMIVVTIAALIGSAALAPWRFTTGLMLGGGLSLLNHHWLKTSVAAIFNINASAQKPMAQSWRYLFRYFVVGVIVFGAYKLRLISLPATLVGLCSFVPALLIEAFRQFYFVIIHREESY